MSTPRMSPVAALDLAPHGHAMVDLAMGRGGTEVARGTWLDAADQPQAKLDYAAAEKAVNASTKAELRAFIEARGGFVGVDDTKADLACRAHVRIFAAWWPDKIATTRQL